MKALNFTIIIPCLYLFFTAVYEEFKAAERQPNSTAPSHLADVCFVVDALGKEEKKAFVKWFCGQRLQSYIATVCCIHIVDILLECVLVDVFISLFVEGISSSAIYVASYQSA